MGSAPEPEVHKVEDDEEDIVVVQEVKSNLKESIRRHITETSKPTRNQLLKVNGKSSTPCQGYKCPMCSVILRKLPLFYKHYYVTHKIAEGQWPAARLVESMWRYPKVDDVVTQITNVVKEKKAKKVKAYAAMAKTHSSKDYPCPHCPEKVKGPKELERHMNTRHCGEGVGPPPQPGPAPFVGGENERLLLLVPPTGVVDGNGYLLVENQSNVGNGYYPVPVPVPVNQIQVQQSQEEASFSQLPYIPPNASAALLTPNAVDGMYHCNLCNGNGQIMFRQKFGLIAHLRSVHHVPVLEDPEEQIINGKGLSFPTSFGENVVVSPASEWADLNMRIVTVPEGVEDVDVKNGIEVRHNRIAQEEEELSILGLPSDLSNH